MRHAAGYPYFAETSQQNMAVTACNFHECTLLAYSLNFLVITILLYSDSVNIIEVQEQNHYHVATKLEKDESICRNLKIRERNYRFLNNIQDT